MTRRLAGDRIHAPRRIALAAAGLLTIMLTVAACAPAGAGAGDPNAPVMTVQVEAADMRFTPEVIEVPSGTRLIIELTNTDRSDVHDLVFANGVKGERLWPDDSETIDVGVITEDLDGWCSVSNHRAMGMVMTVIATEAAG
ncbi:MAG TPA: cupredoxin domain-containing protein [Microbacteriaceae bacterium]|nr:cupredoxin domain-containing protein [Microbacteriaceae bacterium]